MPEPTSTSSRDDVRHFHVHTCLGSGGFGDVYRATMISPGGVRHEVAVKVLHQGLDASSQAVQRLRDEGRMLGVLRHPAILRVHDLVILAGRIALVTEFVDGGDLDRCFKAGDMTLRPLIEIIGQVAAALDAAWNHAAPDGKGQLHLVHRDVKPANIRIGRHGEVKLLDFGIAKAAGVQREARTEAKTVVGSYLYMSPERLMRKDSSGSEGDVYSLGAVLYEGLARRRLFAGVDLKDQLLLARENRHHDRFVKDAIDALHAVDPRARDLALSCLHLEPAKRPTAAQVANACEELADALPGANLRKWARKRGWPTASSSTGELGGRTLTESTIITDTLPSDLLATPAPPPRHGTMVDFLASTVPDAQRSAHTTDSFDEVETAHEPAPPPVPQKLDIKTQIRHIEPPTEAIERPKKPSPDSLAPTQLILDAPERPSGRRWWLWGVALLVLGVVGITLAAASGVGTLLLFRMSETPIEAAPAAPAPEVTPEPVQGTAEPAPEPPAEPVPARSPAPDAVPHPVPAPQPTAVPTPQVREIEVAPSVDPAPAPSTVIITPIPEPDPQPGQAGDGWGEDGGPSDIEPDSDPQPVQPSTGLVRIDGRVPVQLRGQGLIHQPGDVPIGSWEIWADFGDGMTRAGNSLLNVKADGSYTIKCSALRLQCSTLDD